MREGSTNSNNDNESTQYELGNSVDVGHPNDNSCDLSGQ